MSALEASTEVANVVIAHRVPDVVHFGYGHTQRKGYTMEDKELTGEAAFLAEHTMQVADSPEDVSEEEMEEQEPKFYSAAIYFVDRYYGGPEEGGWWYNSGEPIERPEVACLSRVFKTREEAWEYTKEFLNPVCEARNKGKRPISSMASEGEWQGRVEAGWPAEFPKERPHYE